MKIVLEIRFGMVCEAYADEPADVLIIDRDVGAHATPEEDGVHLVHNGEQAYLDHWKAKNDPVETNRFYDDYERIYGALV